MELTEYEVTGLLDSKSLSFADIILEEDLAKTFSIEKQLKNKEVFKIEYRIRTKSGKIKWVEDRGRGVYGPNDKLLFIDGVIIDVTDKVNYISAIEEQNKKLQNIAWTQSHIVRAPLSRIIGLCNLISMQHEEQEELTEKIQYLTSSANELDQIIRDVVKETENVNPKT
jgi:PAS domain S-box-containing protein